MPRNEHAMLHALIHRLLLSIALLLLSCPLAASVSAEVITGTQDFSGTVQNDDTITINNGTFRAVGDTTLAGSGEVLLINGSSARIDWGYPGSGNDAFNLTNQSNTIRGHGQIGPSGNPGLLTNQHVIRAEEGTLNVYSNVTIDSTGGTIEIAVDGTIAGSGLITGGTIAGEGGGLSSLTLKDVATAGYITLGTPVGVIGNLQNDGTLTASGSYDGLEVRGDATLSGTGDVVLNYSSALIDWASPGTGNEPFNLTNESTISGYGRIGYYGNPGLLTNDNIIRAEGGTLSVGSAITIDNTDGTIEVANGGTLNSSGSIEGGQISIANGGTLSGSSGSEVNGSTITGSGEIAGTTLKGVTTSGDFTLGTPVGVIGNLQNDGTLTASGSYDGLEVRGDATLSGTGEVVLNNSSALIDWASPSTGNEPFNLTNESTISGYGRIGYYGNPGLLTNDNIIRAEGGTLSVGSAITIDNTDGTIEIAADGTFTGSGEITGGTIAGEGGTISSLTLKDITTTGDITLGSSVGVKGNLQNDGTLTTTGSYDGLQVRGDATLTGTGEVVLDNSSALIDWASPGTGNEPFNLTNESMIRGYGRIGYSGNPGLLTNQHTIRAEGGTLNAYSNITIDNTDGTIEIAADGTLAGNGEITGGTITGEGGTISGLTLKDIATTGSMTLGTPVGVTGNVQNDGTLTATGSYDGLEVRGDATLTGTGDVVLANSSANINWASPGTGNEPFNLTNESTIRGFGRLGYSGNPGLLTNQHILRAEGGTLSVYSNITIDNTDGTIEIAADGTLSGSSEITGGSIAGEGGALAGVTLRNAATTGDITLGAPVGVIGNLQNDGTLAATGSYDGLEVRGDAALSGSGDVVLANSSANINWASPGTGNEPFNLTNESTIRGSGRLGYSGNPGLLTNQHILRAEGGTLSVYSNITIDNTDGTIEIAADGTLSGSSEITGGTISGEGGALAGMTLRNAATTGNITLGTPVGVIGNLQNDGTLTATGSYDGLEVRGDAALSGTGEVVLANSSANINWASPGTGNEPFNLTNQSTIRGFGRLGYSGNPGLLTNQHILRAEGGTLSVYSNITIDNTNGIIEVADGATLSANSLGGGLLRGDGTLRTDIANTGTVNPGMALGMLTIDGDYQQAATGSMLIEIAGLTLGSEYDQLIVDGNAILGGTLDFRFLDGFAPMTGDRFDFFTVDGSLSGDWPNVRIENLAPGFEYDLLFDSGVYSLIARNDAVSVPEPSTVVLSAMAGLALLGITVRRRRAAA